MMNTVRHYAFLDEGEAKLHMEICCCKSVIYTGSMVITWQLCLNVQIICFLAVTNLT